MMQCGRARKFLNGFFSRDEAVLSRRDMLAGLGLAAVVATAPKLLLPDVAEAKSNAPAIAPEPAKAEAAEPVADQRNAADSTDATEFSARRYYWRRRYWRRRYYWRPRYYRRRYWRRRYYWRPRYYRRRYWRRRYW